MPSLPVRLAASGVLVAALLIGCGDADGGENLATIEARSCGSSPARAFPPLPPDYSYLPVPTKAREQLSEEEFPPVIGQLHEIRLIKERGALPAFVYAFRLPEATSDQPGLMNEIADGLNDDPGFNARRARLAGTPIVRAELNGASMVVGARVCFIYTVISSDVQVSEGLLGALAITPLKRPTD